MTSAIR